MKLNLFSLGFRYRALVKLVDVIDDTVVVGI